MIDKGLGPRAWEDLLETSGDYISIVKLGWGTAYVTPNLKRKLEVLKEKPVVIGGTFLEAVIAQDKIDEYKRWKDAGSARSRRLRVRLRTPRRSALQPSGRR